jgi:hypothetical protein
MVFGEGHIDVRAGGGADPVDDLRDERRDAAPAEAGQDVQQAADGEQLADVDNPIEHGGASAAPPLAHLHIAVAETGGTEGAQVFFADAESAVRSGLESGESRASALRDLDVVAALELEAGRVGESEDTALEAPGDVRGEPGPPAAERSAPSSTAQSGKTTSMMGPRRADCRVWVSS